jgi:hypothetical protein
VFFGGMALGSIVWGQVAALTSIEIALAGAGVGMAAALAIVSRLPLVTPAKEDLKPSLHWAEPSVVLEDANERGRVLTTIEYQTDPADAAGFLAALEQLKVTRLRNGGYGWGVYQDVEAPGRYIEQFLTDSWVEHLRQHERITLADKTIQERVHSYHRGERAPKVSHLASPSDRRARP